MASDAVGDATRLLTPVSSDVVLESSVLVSRRLEDKNESLGLGLEHLVLVSVLKKMSCSFQVFCCKS